LSRSILLHLLKKVKYQQEFFAGFRKPAGEELTAYESKSKGKSVRLSPKEIEVVKPWLRNGDDFFFIKQQEEVIAMPIHLERYLADIQWALYIKKAGVKMGTIIRNELIPDHELATSTIIQTNIPAIEVNKETALNYLRRNEIKLETDIKGWALITHQQLPLGWVKVLPNRVNNYYPKEWRILNK
jgi:NOL1/NOP2/fmu family ribosome biogenesis protein